ncbi:MAG: hypothetical protein OXU36_10620 [Candidatus Poribacteria bacterium]|nr:hypothetical protein [Candidatus Poribacteria bacterium]
MRYRIQFYVGNDEITKDASWENSVSARNSEDAQAILELMEKRHPSLQWRVHIPSQYA